MDIRVILAPTLELAQTVPATATVEAEYGDTVVTGTKVTLAHHSGEYANNPAPCTIDVKPLEKGSTILVSHINPDTVGACLALMGRKPESKQFWQAVGFIDVTGPHNMHKLSSTQQDMLNALWAWSNSAFPKTRCSEITDVTAQILKYVSIIERIIKGDEELINAGRIWKNKTAEAVESCLVTEFHHVRVFRTTNVFALQVITLLL